MYVAIRRYKLKDLSSAAEVVRRVNEGFLPIVSKVPGFVEYFNVDAGGGVYVTISVFTDRAGAENSVSAAADWVKQNLAQFVSGPPEVTTGEVVVHKTG
jgi:hypothetical protein